MSIFQFKQFAINQTNAPFKIGTDGVLLGAYAALIKDCNNVLDIGTGTGLIALMIAQKSAAKIQGIEINEQAFNVAKHNFSNSPWGEQLLLEHISLQEFTTASNKSFDLIVCNPPFFEKSKKSDNHAKNLARHTDSLSIEELIDNAKLLLTEKGSLIVIYPIKIAEKIEVYAKNKGLFLSEKIFIHPTTSKPPKRLILHFSAFDTSKKEFSIIIEKEKRHDYTDEYIKLTTDYYLKF